MHNIVQGVITGIADGALLWLLTFSIVLVSKASHVINMAVGEIAAFAAFIGAIYLVPRGAGVAIVGIVAVLVGAAFGVGTNQIVVRPMRRGPPWSLVLATLVLGLLTQQIEGLVWGYEDRPFPYVFGTGVIRFGGYVLTIQDLTIIVTTAVLIAASTWYFMAVRSGILMRAMAADRTAAVMMGVRAGRLDLASWAIGGAAAGLAGFLAAPALFVSPGMMQNLLLEALAAAVVGGMGSLPGAAVGALVTGVVTSVGDIYVPVAFQPLVPAAIILIALLIRPQGINRRAVARMV